MNPALERVCPGDSVAVKKAFEVEPVANLRRREAHDTSTADGEARLPLPFADKRANRVAAGHGLVGVLDEAVHLAQDCLAFRKRPREVRTERHPRDWVEIGGLQLGNDKTKLNHRGACD